MEIYNDTPKDNNPESNKISFYPHEITAYNGNSESNDQSLINRSFPVMNRLRIKISRKGFETGGG